MRYLLFIGISLFYQKNKSVYLHPHFQVMSNYLKCRCPPKTEKYDRFFVSYSHRQVRSVQFSYELLLHITKAISPSWYTHIPFRTLHLDGLGSVLMG
jgi:hypothetical protein